MLQKKGVFMQNKKERNTKNIVKMIKKVIMGPLGEKIVDERLDRDFNEIMKREYEYNGNDIKLYYKEEGVCGVESLIDVTCSIEYKDKIYIPGTQEDNQAYTDKLIDIYIDTLEKEEEKEIKIK